MATYRSGTLSFIEDMGDQLLELGEEITLENNKRVKRIVLKGADFERILPNKRDLTQQALHMSDHGDCTEQFKHLAARTGKHQTLLNQVVNENKPNKASRDLILCAVLLRDQVPCAEEVDHILLTMRREPLYTHSYVRHINCRNLLIRRCLDYANAGNDCPTNDWLIFTNSVILWFAQQLHIPMAALDAWEPDFGFIKKQKHPYVQLLAKWEQQLEQVGFCYLHKYRNALVYAYLAKHSELKSFLDVQNYIGQKTGYDASYARSVFSQTGNKEGSREMLISSAKVLGCSLKETNLLLRQANMAPLYPYRGVDDAQDALDIQTLRKNPGLLAPEVLEKFLTEGVLDYGEQQLV